MSMIDQERAISCTQCLAIKSSRSSGSYVPVQSTCSSQIDEASSTRALEKVGTISLEQWESERLGAIHQLSVSGHTSDMSRDGYDHTSDGLSMIDSGSVVLPHGVPLVTK